VARDESASVLLELLPPDDAAIGDRDDLRLPLSELLSILGSADADPSEITASLVRRALRDRA